MTSTVASFSGSTPVPLVYRPALWRCGPEILLAVGALLLSATINLPQIFRAGNITGLGLLSLAQCAAIWLLWLHRPTFPRDHWLLLPWMLFVIYITASISFNRPIAAGVQNLVVFFAFFGWILLAAREAQRDPVFVWWVDRSLRICAPLVFVVYAAAVTLWGKSEDNIFGPRAFALFALVVICYEVAHWQFGQRWALLGAALVAAAIFHSMSRTALVLAAFIFPMGMLIHGGRKAIPKTAILGAAMVGALLTAIFLYQPLYHRFFADDASLMVGDVAINASGRTVVWNIIYESFLKAPYLGQGAGSSAAQTAAFENIGHAHNDFLRIAHDYGAVGFALWSLGTIALALRLLMSAQRTGRHPIHLAGFMALLMVTASMMTDNPVVYIFVMAPLGILIGCSLGLSAAALPASAMVPVTRQFVTMELHLSPRGRKH